MAGWAGRAVRGAASVVYVDQGAIGANTIIDLDAVDAFGVLR